MNWRAIFACLFFLLFVIVDVSAQKKKNIPWRKRVKMATELEASGDFFEAAKLYKSVYQEKKDKLEYTYKAGNCYLEFRDYERAVKSLEPVKDDNTLYDKAGFKYAIALKQSGRTEEAKEAFELFLINYQGDEKEIYKEIVDNEIKGCNFAIKVQEYTDPTVTIEHLGAKINTSKTEFAPIPFNNNVLYFSTTEKGNAKIHRTQKKDGDWLRPQVPQIFEGKMTKTHFGNGTFTADGRRFYFTQCEVEGKPNCTIYVMEEQNGEWSDPVELPDYINPPEANTTHPYVVTTTDQEILYFSSNREGGRGGLDLWFSTRPREGGEFTLPKNLGRNINTQGDEISPFYHSPSATLYFSSNGRVSAGGLDIFKSKGSKMQWEVAQNMGFPVNSYADDLYYTISESHGGGYLVSNRAFPPTRKATTDDDIFYFAKENVVIEIAGAVTDKNNPSAGELTDINVKLFEVGEGDEEELIDEMYLAEGFYDLDLEPRKSYIVAITKEGYQIASFPVSTAGQPEKLSNDVELIPLKVEPEEPDWDKIKFSIVPPHYNSNDNTYPLPDDPIDPNTGEPYTGNLLIVYKELKEIAALGDGNRIYYDDGGNPQPYRAPTVVAENANIENENPATPPDEEETMDAGSELIEEVYNEETLAEEGVSYKIQVAAVRKFKAYKYEELKTIGRLAMENIDGGIRRVLVVDAEDNAEGIEGFKSKGKALNVLSYILNNTRFDYAFVVKYVNGERVGEGFRGWNEEEGLQNDVEPYRKSKDKYEGF